MVSTIVKSVKSTLKHQARISRLERDLRQRCYALHCELFEELITITEAICATGQLTLDDLTTMPGDEYCDLIADYDFDYNGGRLDCLSVALDGLGCDGPINEDSMCPHCHWVVPHDKYERVERP